MSATATRVAGEAAAAEAFVQGFADGWRSPAGPDAFADHFDQLITDDVRLIQPQVPTSVGKRAFREEFARPIFALIPDLHATVHNWAATADGVMIEFTLAGTLGSKPVSWPAVDRITLRDGLASERRAYFDPLRVLGAVATRPRAWPRFARIQLLQLRNRLGRN